MVAAPSCETFGTASTGGLSNLMMTGGAGATDDHQELSIFDNKNSTLTGGQVSIAKRSYNFEQTATTRQSLETINVSRNQFFGKNSAMRTIDHIKDNNLLAHNEQGELIKRTVLGDPKVMQQLIDKKLRVSNMRIDVNNEKKGSQIRRRSNISINS